jgi:hypothetical protein
MFRVKNYKIENPGRWHVIRVFYHDGTEAVIPSFTTEQLALGWVKDNIRVVSSSLG